MVQDGPTNREHMAAESPPAPQFPTQVGHIWFIRRSRMGRLHDRQNGVSASAQQNLRKKLGMAQNLIELVTELVTELV